MVARVPCDAPFLKPIDSGVINVAIGHIFGETIAMAPHEEVSYSEFKKVSSFHGPWWLMWLPILDGPATLWVSTELYGLRAGQLLSTDKFASLVSA